MAFVPEGQADRSQARSAWESATPKEPSRRVRCDSFRCTHESIENVISRARSYRTLRDGSFEDAFPGTSCQATIGLSLRDGLQTRFATASRERVSKTLQGKNIKPPFLRSKIILSLIFAPFGPVPRSTLSLCSLWPLCEISSSCLAPRVSFQVLFQERSLSWGWGRFRGSTVFNPDQVKSGGGSGTVGFGFSAGGEQLGDPLDIRSAGRDPDNGAGQHSDHPIQKAAAFELENHQFLSALKADPVNRAGGGDCCLTAIRGK